MSSSKLLELFAEYQKNMHREIGALMGSILAASNCSPPSPSIQSFDGLEERILAAVDARLKGFEEKMIQINTPVRVGNKRGRSPSVCSSDGEEEAPLIPPPVPVKAVIPLDVAVAIDNATIASLTEKLNAIKVEEKPVVQIAEPAPVPATEEKKVETDVKSVEVKTPVKAEAQLKVEVVKKEADEEEEDEGDEEEEEEANEEEEEEADEEEEEEDELTEIVYKGKKYYMDGEYNIYGLDGEGELVEDPVGRYDEKTRRIVFN